MLDDKRLNEIRKNVPLMLNEGSIDKKEENKKFLNSRKIRHYGLHDLIYPRKKTSNL